MAGRVEWYESLRTKDYDEAKERAKVVGIKVDVAFREARKAVQVPAEAGAASDAWEWQEWVRDLTAGFDLPVMPGPAVYDEVTLDDAKTIASAWVRNRLADHENRVAIHGVPKVNYGPVPLPDPPRNWISGNIETYRFQVGRQLNQPVARLSVVDQVRDIRLTSGNIEIAIFEAANRFGLLLDPAGDSWRRLRYAILLATETLANGIERVNSGQGIPESASTTISTVVPTVIPKRVENREPEQKGKLLSELYAMYAAEAGTTVKMAVEHATIFTRFRDIIGGDLPVRVITKAQVVEFKSILFQMPRYLTGPQKKMSLREVVAGTPPDATRLSVASIRKSISILQTIFEWGVKNGIMDTNPVKGAVPAKAKRTAGPARLFFSDEDIKLIFTSPIWAGCESDAKYWEPGTHLVQDERRWLPLLALYTGCRLEELGQLLVRDVRQDAGIWFLDITTINENENGSGKSLKTAGSHRRIPLHPVLVQIGFLDYVQGQTTERVFPNLKRNSLGVLTARYSKIWARYSDKIGLSDTRKTFHSFRHSFKRSCRGVMSNDIHDALTGHAGGGIGGTYGRDEAGGRVSLAILAEAIARVEFPGFPDLK
ncbi:hypothetical protein [Azospirillum doebereinerae]